MASLDDNRSLVCQNDVDWSDVINIGVQQSSARAVWKSHVLPRILPGLSWSSLRVWMWNDTES